MNKCSEYEVCGSRLPRYFEVGVVISTRHSATTFGVPLRHTVDTILNQHGIEATDIHLRDLSLATKRTTRFPIAIEESVDVPIELFTTRCSQTALLLPNMAPSAVQTTIGSLKVNQQGHGKPSGDAAYGGSACRQNSQHTRAD